MTSPEQPSMPPSLWAATAPKGAPHPSLEGTRDVDLAIVGGGFTGLSTALFARRLGLSVAVLEAVEVGFGASGRNNGQVIPTLSRRDPADIVARFGAERGERMVALVRDSANLLFDLVREHGIACEAEQAGWIQPAHSPGRVAIARRRHDAWASRGAPVEFYDREGIAALLGSDAWHGGWGNRSGGHVNPLALARGLAAAVVAAGGAVHERSPATSLSHDRGSWIVGTPGGTLRASRLVLATAAYSTDLWPGLARTIVPVNSWQLATSRLGENVRATVVPGRHAVSDTRGELGFFRHDGSGRLVTGGASMLSLAGIEGSLRARVGGRLGAWFPQLAGIGFDHAWSGKLGVTTDFFPHIHRLGESGFAWIGCNGRGVALAVSMGRELARLSAGEREEQVALPFTPIQPIPWHGFARRIGPPLALWGYRRADRREVG